MKYLAKVKKTFDTYGFILYPFLSILIVGFFVYFFPYPFIPDWLNISNYSKIYETFNLIISSLVSLVGIYISVSLVAYEFFKQKSGIDYHKSLLLRGLNAYFISSSVIVILFTFCCSLFVPSSNPTNQEIALIYYNCILFILVIAALFPVAFNLFSSLRPERLANEELNKINSSTIFIRTFEKDDIDKQAEIYEKDHLLRIETIVFALISVSDNIKAQAIIQKVTTKLSVLIIESEIKAEKEYIIDRLLSFYIKIIDLSLQQPNSALILGGIWKAISRMYEVLIERKETAVNYEKFRKDFFPRYFNRLIENNKEEVLFDGITTIRHIIQRQVLENMADDNEIYFFNGYRESCEKDFKYPDDYSDLDFKKEQHWTEIAVETISCLTYLLNKAIVLNKPDLINKCFEQIQELNFTFNLKNIGIYKQTYFYINAANITCDYAYQSFKKNVFLEGHEANHIMPSLFTNLIERKHIAARTVLQKYCHLLIDLQKINKLDRWFLGGLTIGDFITTEGELGGIAKRCAIKFKDGNEIQDCLEDCINCFKILKDYYEINPPHNYGLYTVIKWQFKNILEWIEKEKVDDQNLMNNLKGLISSFKEKEDTI